MRLKIHHRTEYSFATPVPYALQRVRRRSIGFTVGADGLAVRAPTWVTLSAVDAALREKSGWILRKLNESRERQQRIEAQWRGLIAPHLLAHLVVRPARRFAPAPHDWLLALLLLAFITSAALGPIVVEERTKRRWDVLLATPVGVESVLLGKVGGALWWIRYLIIGMGALLALLAAGIGFISLVLIPTGLTTLEDLPIFFLCGAALALPIASAIVFVIDRIQQYLLMVVAALTASASATSMRAAFATSAAAVLFVWVAEFTLAGILLALQVGATKLSDITYMLALAVLGPMVGYIIDMDLIHAVLYAAGTLLLREILIDTLWRWSLRKARPV